MPVDGAKAKISVLAEFKDTDEPILSGVEELRNLAQAEQVVAELRQRQNSASSVASAHTGEVAQAAIRRVGGYGAKADASHVCTSPYKRCHAQISHFLRLSIGWSARNHHQMSFSV